MEILSSNDFARETRDFFASLSVRELLIVDRYPWALELYRLDAGRLDLVGASTPDQPEALTSTVLPLRLRLVASEVRPRIEVSRTVGEQTWLL